MAVRSERASTIKDLGSDDPRTSSEKMLAYRESVNAEEMKRDGLRVIDFNAYSVGHVFNDLCASMWFVYLTWYINTVVGLSQNVSGLCVLSGQIADGICTPITGFASDNFETRWGKRFPWYVVGSIIVLPCFAGIFMYLPFVNKLDSEGEIANKTFQEAWYITLPALFNVGWAMVQISHMAIVNSLTNSNRRRDRMVNFRNGFTYFANITVLTTAMIVFEFSSDNVEQFRIMCVMCLIVGSCCSLFFMCVIKEKKLSEAATLLESRYQTQLMGPDSASLNELRNDNKESDSKDWRGWLGEGTFYVHGIVYMLVRIAVNVTMTVQPFYLQNVLDYKGTLQNPTPIPLAAVPLGSYVTSLIFSMYFQAPMTRCLRNRMYPLLVSIVIITISSLPMMFLPGTSNIRNLIYPMVAVQGVGLAIMLNTATSLISDVIGTDSENSAFVYGVYSLFDKFANGFLLYWIVAMYSHDPDALRYIMAISPVACSILAYGMTYIGQKYYSHKMAKITGIQPREDEMKKPIK